MDFLSEYDFRIRIMQAVVELEFRILARLFNRPSGEAARDFRYIFLCVAAVHAERVQLHQLAAIIFIQTAFLLFLLTLLRQGRRRPAEWAPSRLTHRSLGSDSLL